MSASGIAAASSMAVLPLPPGRSSGKGVPEMGRNSSHAITTRRGLNLRAWAASSSPVARCCAHCCAEFFGDALRLCQGSGFRWNQSILISQCSYVVPLSKESSNPEVTGVTVLSVPRKGILDYHGFGVSYIFVWIKRQSVVPHHHFHISFAFCIGREGANKR